MKKMIFAVALAALCISCSTAQVQTGIAVAETICDVVAVLGAPRVIVPMGDEGDKSPAVTRWIFTDGSVFDVDASGRVVDRAVR